MITIGICAGALILFIAFCCMIYKVAPMNKVLIVTGGKEPKLKVSGGSFVIPIFRKASYFDLSLLTVKADDDEVKTKTSIPIVINWTAQVRPCSSDIDVLKKAVISFQDRKQDGIIEDVKRTLAGCVVSTVAQLSPLEVMVEKETFKKKVQDDVADELREMGLELVSLNIGEITDRNGYYADIAAQDRESKKKDAAKAKAEADQLIREQVAISEKSAKEAELQTELQIEERTKENNIKKAQFKTETDQANADAAIAGQLRQTERLQELAEKEGKVEITKQEQANLVAIKEKEVTKTKAEAEKLQAEIKAEEAANVATINAKANAKVAEEEAIGKAKAIEAEAKANANKIKIEGETEAAIITKKGIAEAEATKAKKLAEAEGEKALAEARAGNDKVNFEIEKIKLTTQAKIEIATKTAQIMADLGKNAEFVNIGGGGREDSGNALFDTLSRIPSLMKTLNVENEALNGKGINDEIRALVESVVDPAKGILHNETTSNTTINNATPEVIEG